MMALPTPKSRTELLMQLKEVLSDMKAEPSPEKAVHRRLFSPLEDEPTAFEAKVLPTSESRTNLMRKLSEVSELLEDAKPSATFERLWAAAQAVAQLQETVSRAVEATREGKTLMLPILEPILQELQKNRQKPSPRVRLFGDADDGTSPRK